MVVRLWSHDLIHTAHSFFVNPNTCSDPAYFENFIRYSAITDQNSGRGVTHVFLNDDETVLCGFITLKCASIMTDSEHGEPAVEIMNLAVSRDHEHMGFGRALVDLAVVTANFLNDRYIGARFLVLAASKSAVPFYEHLLFSPFRDYWKLPRETTNESCTPMFMQLHI